MSKSKLHTWARRDIKWGTLEITLIPDGFKASFIMEREETRETETVTGHLWWKKYSYERETEVTEATTVTVYSMDAETWFDETGAEPWPWPYHIKSAVTERAREKWVEFTT